MGVRAQMLGWIFALAVLSGCGQSVTAPSDTERVEETDNLEADAGPVYLTDSMNNLEKQNSRNSMIRSKRTGGNHFYIDENGVLWGTGRNSYWQLGIEKEEDRGELGVYYTEPVKIAEHVIHVDASNNMYFVIYLTEDHTLYGLGANTCGVLRRPAVFEERYNMQKNITAEPCVLMEHVAFASAGRESVSVLTEEGDVWWWGTFRSTSATAKVSEMYEPEPVKMVEHAVYTVCGNDFAAAVDQDGNLWTWGNNVWGQCGTVPSSDYIKSARKVCSQVEMAWTECLSSGNYAGTIVYEEDENPYGAIYYACTLFVRKNDGNYYACGIDLGSEEKTAKVYGDIGIADTEEQNDFTHRYSSEFVPVTVREAAEAFGLPEKTGWNAKTQNVFRVSGLPGRGGLC